MSLSSKDNNPHSVAIWIHWEIHERMATGHLSGSPKELKDYRAVIHCENKNIALEEINKVISNLQKDIENVNQRLRTTTE